MSLFYVDSSCDLGYEQVRSMGIEYFNLPYVLDGKNYEITEEFDFKKFYSKVRKGIDVKYLALEEKEYIKIFESALKSGDDIVYVYSSREIFDCSNLIVAKEKLCKKYPERRFEIIDSKNFSIGHGALCFLMALQYKNGSTFDELIDYYYEVVDSVASYVIVDSLEGLQKYGLIDNSSAVGSALNIKYILAIDIDGKFKLVDKVSGKKRAVNKLIQLIRQTGQNLADNPLFFANAHDEEYESSIINVLKEYLGEELKVFNGNISPSNLAISGNNAIVVSFRVYKKIH